MKLDRRAIAQRIPHAGAMCLLDEVTVWDDNTVEAISRSHTDPDSPLAMNGSLHGVHLVEYAAQAAAVHGALAGESGDGSSRPRRGMLAGLRNATLHVKRLGRDTGVLSIHARRLFDQPGGCLYQARIEADGRVLFEGRLAVSFQD